jgi:ubiquinone/menaquinone biosynthesis C-methylase UbiE
MNWYDETATGYDELHGQEQRQKFAVFDDYINDDLHVLDVGFGTGLSDGYYDAEIVGVEPSQGMLDEFDGNATTYNAAARDLDELFDPNSFDAVLCVSTAHHFDNAEQAFHNIERVIRPGGHLFLSTFNKAWPACKPFLADYSIIKKESVERDTVVVANLST